MRFFILYGQPIVAAIVVFASSMYLGAPTLLAFLVASVPIILLWLFRARSAVLVYAVLAFVVAVVSTMIPQEFIFQFKQVAKEILSIESV